METEEKKPPPKKREWDIYIRRTQVWRKKVYELLIAPKQHTGVKKKKSREMLSAKLRKRKCEHLITKWKTQRKYINKAKE